MIPKTMDELIATEQEQRSRDTRAQRTQRVLAGSAVGAGLAVAVSMFALKHEINKIYFDLSERIQAVETQQPYNAPATTLSPVPTITSAPAGVQLEVHIYTDGRSLTEACITPNNGVYEVRPC